jgi:hypothetical protein
VSGRIEQRQILEAASSSKDSRNSIEALVIPRAVDALYGRGVNAQQHSGNIRYHILTDTNQNRCDATDSRLIAYEIAQAINEHGRCFLKQDQTGWVVVDDTLLREAKQRMLSGVDGNPSMIGQH